LSETILDAIRSASGLSRRNAFAAIRAGRVTEGGIAVVDPSRARGEGELTLDGAVLSTVRPPRAYLLLNKPPGIVTSAADELGRGSILDLVPRELAAPGLHSAGRLDRDTSGLLILTNDGDLTFRLTHPRHEIDKEYWLASSPRLDREQVERLRQGIEIDGGVRVPVRVAELERAAPFQLSLAIKEGRKRQVRRMVEAVGGRVVALRRVREGPLALGNLPEGGVRRLSPAEVDALKLA
jgi:23S rRNA pseudouridine2605 synthase